MSCIIIKDYERCKHCGQRFDQHGLPENPHGAHRCPAPKPFPKFPFSVDKRQGFEAGQLVWGKRLASYWTARKTSFERGVSW
jgi:hypothetical protein